MLSDDVIIVGNRKGLVQGFEKSTYKSESVTFLINRIRYTKIIGRVNIDVKERGSTFTM